MKKVLFIINPTAGKERMKRYLISVLDLFTKADDPSQLLAKIILIVCNFLPVFPDHRLKNRARILI